MESVRILHGEELLVLFFLPQRAVGGFRKTPAVNGHGHGVELRSLITSYEMRCRVSHVKVSRVAVTWRCFE